MIKITFVYLDYSKGSQGKFYHGLASLSGILKAHGFKVSLVHAIEESPSDKIAAQVIAEKPDVAAFSTTTNMFADTARVASILKERSQVLTIAGGIHPTISPDETIAEPGFDIICIGEGEYPLLELAQALAEKRDHHDIENLWVKTQDGVIKNGLRPLENDLDKLPLPDHDLFDYSKLEDARLHRVVMMATRGCPYECAFCCNHLLKRLYKGKYIRFRSVDNVVKEGMLLKERFNPEYAVFHDDILTIDKNWLREFSAKWKREVDLKFSCNSRVNLLDEEAISLLAEAGCFEISMGIESGDPQIRETVLKRHMSNAEIIEAFRLCHEHDIKTIAYNMVGLPFETMTKVLETVKLNALAKPSNVQVSIFYPFPHTHLYEIARDNGFLTGRKAGSYFEEPVISQPSIDESEVRYLFANFGALVKAYAICYTLPKQLRTISANVLTGILKTKAGRDLFAKII